MKLACLFLGHQHFECYIMLLCRKVWAGTYPCRRCGKQSAFTPESFLDWTKILAPIPRKGMMGE